MVVDDTLGTSGATKTGSAMVATGVDVTMMEVVDKAVAVVAGIWAPRVLGVTLLK